MSDSEDYDFEFLPKKAFDVGNIPKHVDLSAPPKTGLEYLYQVKYESQLCSEVLKADIDTDKFQTNNDVKKNNECQPAPPGYAPTVEWSSKQIKNFSTLRQKLSYKKGHFKNKPSVSLPTMNDMHAWYVFCYGQLTDKDTELMSDSANRKEVVKEGHLPLLSILTQLIQPNIETLLSYQTKWLRKYGFSHEQGRWIYALLACLEKPLTPSAHSLLRDLVRTCADMRTELKSKNDEFLKPLNLIICLVAHYFKQLDMSDLNFNNTLEIVID